MDIKYYYDPPLNQWDILHDRGFTWAPERDRGFAQETQNRPPQKVFEPDPVPPPKWRLRREFGWILALSILIGSMVLLASLLSPVGQKERKKQFFCGQGFIQCIQLKSERPRG